MKLRYRDNGSIAGKTVYTWDVIRLDGIHWGTFTWHPGSGFCWSVRNRFASGLTNTAREAFELIKGTR